MFVLESTHNLFGWRERVLGNQKIGFVPTMGGLHEGHLSLIRRSLEESDLSVVSVFLNPKQFSNNEDLGAYPVDVAGDLEKLSSLNVDVVFLPTVHEIYSDGDCFSVLENKLSLLLEGKSRPHFFPGVLTVVSKLFNLVRPYQVYFGKKDAQQLILIKKLIENMKYPIRVVACETMREHHGLAMSSRNEYLNTIDRGRAKIIFLSLLEAKKMLDQGINQSCEIREKIKSILLTEPGLDIDYISIADSTTLIECEGCAGDNILISVAVFFCGVRLVDNIFYNH